MRNPESKSRGRDAVLKRKHEGVIAPRHAARVRNNRTGIVGTQANQKNSRRTWDQFRKK